MLRVYVIFCVVPCDLLDIKGYVILTYSLNRNGYCIVIFWVGVYVIFWAYT